MKSIFLTMSSYIAAAACLALTGCGREPPVCGDPQVQASLAQVLQNRWSKMPQSSKFKLADLAKVSYELPVMTAYDKDARIRSCQVTMKLDTGEQKAAEITHLMSIDTAAVLSMGPLFGMSIPEVTAAYATFMRLTGNTMKAAAVQDVSLSYKVQLDEGSGSSGAFIVSTQVDEAIAYLTITTLAEQAHKAPPKQDTPAPAAEPAPVIVPQAEAGDKALELAAQHGGNFMVTPVTAEPCGSESICIRSQAGGTFQLNAATLDDQQVALINDAVKARTPICLRELGPIDDSKYTAESVAKTCP